MALSKSTMAATRLAELKAAYPQIQMSGDIYDEMIKYYEADSEGIIKEFVANAVVPPGIDVSVDPTTHKGATTGPGKVT